jgi:hypothetical protein
MSINKKKEIFNGFFNLVKDELNLLDKNTKKLAETRANICKGCPANVNKICNALVMVQDIVTNKSVPGCGCYLPAKVLSKESKCPANKW